MLIRPTFHITYVYMYVHIWCIGDSVKFVWQFDFVELAKNQWNSIFDIEIDLSTSY